MRASSLPARATRRARPWPAGLFVLLAGMLPDPAAAQRQAADASTVEQRSREISFSLFVLTNSGFTAGGYAAYDDSSTSAKFNIYNLPLRQRFETGLLGPMELRLTFGYGEAKSDVLQTVAAIPGAVADENTRLSNWSGRVDLGRPIALTPQLTFTPMLGLGYSSWNGRVISTVSGPIPTSSARADFWADALLYDAIGILEYRQPWRDLVITPGLAINYTYIDSFDGRGNVTDASGAPIGRGPIRLSGASTLLRGAVRVEGPLGFGLGEVGLRWQSFVVTSYEASANALFPWSVEIGAALGAEFGALGRRVLGLDPGTLFLGASYIVGENLQGVRANFGFRF